MGQKYTLPNVQMCAKGQNWPGVLLGPSQEWGDPGCLGWGGRSGRECELLAERASRTGSGSCRWRSQRGGVAQSLPSIPDRECPCQKGTRPLPMSPSVSSFPPVSPSPGRGRSRDRQWGEGGGEALGWGRSSQPCLLLAHCRLCERQREASTLNSIQS